MTGAGMQITTRELPDRETLAAVFGSAKIEPWQTGLDAASLAACENSAFEQDANGKRAGGLGLGDGPGRGATFAVTLPVAAAA